MKRLFPFLLTLVFLYGVIYASDSERSRRLALRSLVARAQADDPKALFDLARLHDSGYDSIPVDSTRSKALYLLSAEKGYAPARNFVGFRYYNGDGFAHDIDSALYWINMAVEDGDITAASNLGYLLSQSSDIEHDYVKALSLLQKASEAGLPSAMSQLADLKRMGLGCNPDTFEAVSLYEQAARKGVTDAELKLIAMMGFKWKELPSDSALSLGISYYEGGLPMAGAELIENVAGNGDAKAMAIMGDAYSRGYGVEYDHQKSIDYFFKAAEKGDPSAQFIIAELLEIFPDALSSEESKSENPEYKDAGFWYEQAKSGGVTDSESAYLKLFSLP